MRRVRCGGDLYHRQVPDGAVYIGRPSKWQNPFPVTRYGLDGALRLYRGWVAGDQRAVATAREAGCKLALFGPELVNVAVAELAGSDLACWCGAGARCHGDHLIAVVEAQLRLNRGRPAGGGPIAWRHLPNLRVNHALRGWDDNRPRDVTAACGVRPAWYAPTGPQWHRDDSLRPCGRCLRLVGEPAGARP